MSARFLCAFVCLLGLGVTPLRAQSSAAALNEAGWKMIQKGEPARAAKLFADALALQPDEPVLLFGAGVSAHLQDRSSDAKPRLRRALEVNPRFTAASLLLGEILYGEGELDQAIRTYEKALTFAPANRDLTAGLQNWRKEADVHHSFIERRQDRFRVMFEGRTDAALAARTTDALNTAFWRIGQELRAYPSNAIVVILYTEKQFRDITRAPEWSDGYYDGRIRIPVAGATRAHPALFESVLVHELTHAMVTSLAPRGVPAWLHEGLAQHFEGADARAARRRLQTHGRRIPLDQLEGSFSNLTPAGAFIAYDESLVAVTAIIERASISWTQVLYALAESDRPAETLRGFGVAYADLEASFAR
ncbi:MAG TPA: tetratricopeptide repeat protein [Vicinamibacterales bacterium]|nr:tetratricopeptide repeat protein [Vicinamibacterales bacterium]